MKKLKIKYLNISDWSTVLFICTSFCCFTSFIFCQKIRWALAYFFNDRLCKQYCITRNFIRAQRSSDLSKRYFRAIPACNFRRQRRRLRAGTLCFATIWEFSENLTLLQSCRIKLDILVMNTYTPNFNIVSTLFHSYDFSKNRICSVYKTSLEYANA